jgi:hypothetical protein
MQNTRLSTVFFLLFLAASQVHAITSEEFFSQAIEKGSFAGELTDDVSAGIKKTTHSTAPTKMTVENIGIMPDGCRTFKVSITQPDIPTVEGVIAGDYLAVTKVVVCKDGREQAEPVVLDCKIGKISCMPKPQN